MRLIDADKLRHELIMGHDLVGAKYTDIADTVKAIPVEWFKKQIDWHSETLTYGAEVYQWVLNRWYEDKEIWEKENESRKGEEKK